jgi:hypothetical protein
MEAWRRLIGMRSADCRAASGSLPTRQGVTGDGPHHLVELVTTAATPEPRRPCPERGHTPPEDQGQQQTLVVYQRPSSAAPFAQDCRSSDDPGALSHGESHLELDRGLTSRTALLAHRCSVLPLTQPWLTRARGTDSCSVGPGSRCARFGCAQASVWEVQATARPARLHGLISDAISSTE